MVLAPERQLPGKQTRAQDPGSAGGEAPLGTDPARSESGRPGSDDGDIGGGGTDVDDPFANESNGGAGEAGGTDVDDPFANESNGGAGEAGGTDVDDPFANDPNGGAGEGENTNVDDPFANDPFGGAGSGGVTETGPSPGSSDPLRTRRGNSLSTP